MASRRRTRFSVFAAALLSLAMITGPALSAGAQEAVVPPTDYIALSDTLSQPTYTDTVTEVVTVEAFDGEELYLEITKPNPATYPGESFPVILEASPYHGTIADAHR